MKKFCLRSFDPVEGSNNDNQTGSSVENRDEADTKKKRDTVLEKLVEQAWEAIDVSWSYKMDKSVCIFFRLQLRQKLINPLG